ncbi:hypothetical protein [Streptomyces sp. Cmuel-A718b]|uniref:hypothetical protein n=1 Tax=Streptomyces sp. Cmuel-A718b TaxID=697328 RepID=UPI00081EE1D6|nr:hypothetical protein [Streptomyces sp. Cmuel-A718b]SCF88663.1 hypothetical protein GA0115280_118244 [Streptomyces sp. Cmuel-A718b]
MIKLTWALVAEHMDEWTGDDIAQGAAVLEARVGAVVDASGMKPETVEHWRTDFLAPVVDSLRAEGTAALAQGESWSKAAGPLLACASSVG